MPPDEGRRHRRVEKRAVGERRFQASVVQRLTATWSGWPVMPSGPNVTMRSGRTSSMSASIGGRAVFGDAVAGPVGYAELVALAHADLPTAAAQLPHAPLAEPRRRPARRVVRPELAAGRGDQHHTAAARGRRRSINPALRYASSSGWAHTPSSVRAFDRVHA